MQVQNASLTPRQGVTIFGSTNQDFCEEFEKMMASEFEMSIIMVWVQYLYPRPDYESWLNKTNYKNMGKKTKLPNLR